MKKNQVKNPIYFIAAVYFFTVLLFMFFRFLFLKFFPEAGTNTAQLKTSFATGADFDLMVGGYIILLPGFLLCMNFLLKKPVYLFNAVAILLLNILLSISILICCADIPYYKFFNSRITTSILMWVGDFSQSMKFIFSDKKFYPFMLLFFALLFFQWKIINILNVKLLYRNGGETYPFPLRLLLALLSFVFMGSGLMSFNRNHAPAMREAFFSTNSFINQLTLNPVLTFFESFSAFRIDYMADEKALQNAARYLGIKNISPFSPVLRFQKNDSLLQKKNVILILMEGMSAHRMNYFGGKKNLTPFLDSLAGNSLFFSNCYSCGIHTCNGVYGTLFGMPSLMAKHPMSNVQSANLFFGGMPLTLKKNNYSTLYFCTHGEEFDNIGYFLPRNGIDKIWGQKDYPADNVENAWGVSDEFLFSYSLSKIDSVAARGNLFFSTILTISTHPPQQMPKRTEFKPKSTVVFDQVYEYSDWALKNFLNDCKKKSWYNNTVFVFLADHGINLPSNLEAPLSLNHIPMIIFSPDTSVYKKVIVSDLAIQCDVYPTLMNLLGISYENNTMGIDLLKQKRPYAYFSQDNRLCVINDEFYFVADKYGSEFLYKYKTGSDFNYINTFTHVADSMKNYAYSFLQTTQWMIENKKTSAVK